jgi:hypothetical protein
MRMDYFVANDARGIILKGFREIPGNSSGTAPLFVCYSNFRREERSRRAAAAVSPSTFASNFFVPAGLYREIYGEGAGDGRQKPRNFASVSSDSRVFPAPSVRHSPPFRRASFRPIGARRLLKRGLPRPLLSFLPWDRRSDDLDLFLRTG